jgi:hypothetical protein
LEVVVEEEEVQIEQLVEEVQVDFVVLLTYLSHQALLFPLRLVMEEQEEPSLEHEELKAVILFSASMSV